MAKVTTFEERVGQLTDSLVEFTAESFQEILPGLLASDLADAMEEDDALSDDVFNELYATMMSALRRIAVSVIAIEAQYKPRARKAG